MKKSTISEIISLLFVILFLYTGISKLMDYDIAKEQIGLTPLLAPIAPAIVVIIPIAEIITAILLFLPKTRGYALWASLGLMMAFTTYVIYILSYNDQLPCTCGGVLEQLTWPEHLMFNLGMIILALAGIMLFQQPSRKNNKKSRTTAVA